MAINNKISTVAKFTVLDSIKGKIFNGSLIVLLIIAVISLISSELSYKAKTLVILDFGIGLTSIYTVFLSIYFGSTLLANEIENRTLFCVLTRPLKRYQFILGKFLGISFSLILITCIGTTFTLFLYYLNDGALKSIHYLLYVQLILESLLALSCSLFLSLICNKVLCSIYSALIILFGHSVNEIEHFEKNASLLKQIISFFKIILPNLSLIDYKTLSIYQQNITSEFILKGSFSIFFYILFALTLLVMVFNRKNLD